MSFLTFLRLIAERYITSSQGRPEFSVGRPVDRVDRPWPTRPKPKTATVFKAKRVLKSVTGFVFKIVFKL